MDLGQASQAESSVASKTRGLPAGFSAVGIRSPEVLILIFWCDATVGSDCCCFNKGQAWTSLDDATKMGEGPVGKVAAFC